MTRNVLESEEFGQVGIGVSKTKKELVDYILNCTAEKLFEMCDVLNSSNIRVTSWSCEECEKYINSNNLPCDGIERCLEYFTKMDQTKNIKEEAFYGRDRQSDTE